ncbi:MAG: hypothetical protein WAN14_16025 [Candidatus Acidiferrales bacterium]
MRLKKILTYGAICSAAILFPLYKISAAWNSNGSNRIERIETTASAGAQQVTPNPATTVAQAAPAPAERDGSHDFDFEVGTWTIQLKKRLNPLTGSKNWVEFDGTSKTFKIWDGRAQIEQFETDSPAAGRIEGLTLRTYNPTAHEWRLSWANSKTGILDPAQVGKFKDGRGEFYCQDRIGGRTIFIRFIWSDITANSAHFEQSFSDDGGKTWEVNWITDQTRVSEEAFNAATRRFATVATSSAPANSAERDGQHDFDPIVGSWKFELKRRMHPMTGSNTWVDLSGAGVCYKIWDGRAQLDTVELDGSTEHIEGLTLRLYDPTAHVWRLYWANSRIGILDPPQVGKFTDGHGDFYAQDTINGKTLLIRYDWTKLTTSAPHFEQSFSDDGGKTWEANFISDQTRIGDTAAGAN